MFSLSWAPTWRTWRRRAVSPSPSTFGLVHADLWPMNMADTPKVRAWVAATLPGLVQALRRYADGACPPAMDGPAEHLLPG
jgi:hypothetical protein